MDLKGCRFTKDHEWICREPDNTGKIGLTAYAEEQLGDIVFLDLPAVGTTIERGKKLGEVESVKAVSEIFAPATGKIVEVNKPLTEHPEVVNEDPYGAGWLVKIEITQPEDLDGLLDKPAYDRLVTELTQAPKA
jgi:glycine cleavage system H protein